MTEHYQSDGELRSLVSEFEACSFHPSEFRHHQHLAVALWYITHLPYEAARQKMKSGIQRLAATHGKTGYHETITEFWLRMTRGFLAEHDRNEAIASLVNQLIEKYDDKDLIAEYYSAELLASPEAKSSWVDPDLKPLPN